MNAMQRNLVSVGVIVLLAAGLVFSATSIVITVYNTIVKSKVRVEQALRDLDSIYQRRYALVDNLVAIVKETRAFEKYQIEVEQAIYPRVAEAKAQATKLDVRFPDETTKRMTQESRLTNVLMQTLDKLLILAQHYPTITDPVLKDRPATFQALNGLKTSLQTLEGDIQTARQGLNEAVRIYNQNIQIFPANVFAGGWGFKTLAGFEALNAEARQDVKVAF